MVNITITSNEDRQRLDRFLKKYLCNASLSMIYRLVRKDVKVNGRRVKEDTMLVEGDVVSIYLDEDDISDLSHKKRRAKAKRQCAYLIHLWPTQKPVDHQSQLLWLHLT